MIIAHFCNDFDIDGNNRFNYLANLLAESYEVELVTTDFSHRKKAYRTEKTPDTKFKITMLHEGVYKKNISPQRLIAHRTFGKSLRKYLRSLVEKPDVIYCAVPSPDAAYEAGAFAAKNEIKFIIDIQDLWPEAFLLALNIPPLFYPMKRKANRIYQLADEIVAVSEEYCNRAKSVNTKSDSIHPVFIGTKLSDYDENVLNNPFEKNSDEFVLAYAGSLSKSYDIKCAIDAVSILQDQGYNQVKLLIMGDGHMREELTAYASDKGLNNIEFTGHLPYPQMCGRLSASDASLNLIVRGAAQSIINKHADYAAAGNPVINSQECDEYRKLVDTYEMGLNCICEDPDDMAEKIRMLINNPTLKEAMGKNARKCAHEKFDRENTYKEIVSLIVS